MASQHPPSALNSSSSPAPDQSPAPQTAQAAQDAPEATPKGGEITPPAPVFSDWAAI